MPWQFGVFERLNMIMHILLPSRSENVTFAKIKAVLSLQNRKVTQHPA